MRDLAQLLKTSRASPMLIKRLNGLAFFEVADFLANQILDAKQFFPSQKMEAKLQLLQGEGLLHMLFPMKDLSNLADLSEVVKRLHIDPRYAREKECLQHLFKYFM